MNIGITELLLIGITLAGIALLILLIVKLANRKK
jgi:hypothetical protein